MDMRDIFLEAVAEVQEIVRDVMQELAAPQMQQQVAAMWATSPDDIMEQFKQERPQEYAALMEMTKGR
jgi:hypothetical protein